MHHQPFWPLLLDPPIFPSAMLPPHLTSIVEGSSTFASFLPHRDKAIALWLVGQVAEAVGCSQSSQRYTLHASCPDAILHARLLAPLVKESDDSLVL